MTTSTALSCDPKVLDSLTPHQLLDEITQIREQYVREVPGQRRSWPESLRARVLALARLGVQPSKIAKMTGISRASVFLWCSKVGQRDRVSQRPKSPKTQFLQVSPRPVVRQDSDPSAQMAPSHRQTPEPGGLRLKLPSGHEFMGLESIPELLALYRALEGSGS